jgi:hypothetical protein
MVGKRVNIDQARNRKSRFRNFLVRILRVRRDIGACNENRLGNLVERPNSVEGAYDSNPDWSVRRKVLDLNECRLGAQPAVG